MEFNFYHAIYGILRLFRGYKKLNPTILCYSIIVKTMNKGYVLRQSGCGGHTKEQILANFANIVNEVKLSDNFTLYETSDGLIDGDNYGTDMGSNPHKSIIVVIQENKQPYTCGYHKFSYGEYKFKVCDSQDYQLFRLESL